MTATRSRVRIQGHLDLELSITIAVQGSASQRICRTETMALELPTYGMEAWEGSDTKPAILRYEGGANDGSVKKLPLVQLGRSVRDLRAFTIEGCNVAHARVLRLQRSTKLAPHKAPFQANCSNLDILTFREP